MKISPKKYAMSLLEATEGKSKDEVVEIIGRLVKVMAERNQLNKADAVIDNFIKYWNAKESLSLIEVTTAKEMDKESKEAIKDYAAKKFGSKNVELEESVDPNILGGFVIKEGDKVYDASVKARLFELRERIVR